MDSSVKDTPEGKKSMWSNAARKLAEVREIDGHEILSTLSVNTARVVYVVRRRDSSDTGLLFLYPEHRRVASFALEAAVQMFCTDAVGIGKLAIAQGCNIVHAGVSDGTPYLVTTGTGQPLFDILRHHGKLPPYAAIKVLRQCAQAIDAYHDCGILHLALSSESVFIDAHGVVSVEGFGASTLLERYSGIAGSSSINAHPSYSYRSPEQILDQNLSRRSDLFTFGIIAYEALTGFSPFGGASLDRMEERIVEGQHRDLSLLMKNAPTSADEIFARMLATKADARYPTAQQFIHELEAAFEEANLLRARKFDFETVKDLHHPKVANDPDTGFSEIRRPTGAASNVFVHRTAQPLFDGAEPLQARVLKRSRVMSLKLSVIGFLALLTLGAILLVVQSQPSATIPVEPVDTTVDPWIEPPVIAQVSADRPVAELSEQEISGILWEGATNEARTLEVLTAAEERRIKDLAGNMIRPMSSVFPSVRAKAVRIAGELGDRRVQTHVFTLLEDSNDEVRYQAAVAMKRIGDSKSIGFLMSRYMSEESPRTKQALKEAIEMLNGFPLGE